jgi:hypothetical protein
MHLKSDLECVASIPKSEDLSRFVRDIAPEWIEEALAATGTATLRRRRLPMEQVPWLVIGMALLRGRPITEVVDSLDLENRPGGARENGSRLRISEIRSGAGACQRGAPRSGRSAAAACGVRDARRSPLAGMPQHPPRHCLQPGVRGGVKARAATAAAAWP